ncbi:MAG TPA: FAD-dependent oxidoreductase [Pseudonocardia sp.]|nr:FAD-dependent oxidoreductase [Pseudonocardia sp.]
MTGPATPVRVAVVGGGISGLAAAQRLRALLGPSAVITVLEQRDRVGGVLRTVDLAGVPYDVGAEAFLVRRPEVLALLDELGLAGETVHPTAAAPSIRAGGRTVPLPPGTLLGVPTSTARLDRVLSAEGLAAVAAEPGRPLEWEPGTDVALGALLRERLGDEVADRLADPLLGGVYAGRVDALGLRATLPALAAALDAGASSLTAAADAAADTATATPATATTASSGPASSDPASRDVSVRESRVSGARVAGFGRASRGFPARESRVSGARVAGFGRASRGFRARESGPPGTRAGEFEPASRGPDVLGSGVSGPRAAGPDPGAETLPRSAAPVFGALRGGYQVLLDALVAAARADVRLGTTVRELHRREGGWRLVLGPTTAPEVLDADAVVLAVPAPAVARLLGAVAPAAARAAGEVELASSVVVALAYRTEDAEELPATSGVLVAADEPLSVKGITHSSRKWVHLAPDGLVRLRASLGRFGEAATLQVDDATLLARVRADLAELSGLTAEPVAVRVQRWGGGLPQYAVGHLDRVRAIEQGLPAGLAVAGAALHGVGVPACVGTARAAAEQLAAQLAPAVPVR